MRVIAMALAAVLVIVLPVAGDAEHYVVVVDPIGTCRSLTHPLKRTRRCGFSEALD